MAVEVALPDAPARERLLALYGRGVPLALTGDDVAAAVERTDGTTASFLKELIRRSVLEALHEAAAGRLQPARLRAGMARDRGRRRLQRSTART